MKSRVKFAAAGLASLIGIALIFGLSIRSVTEPQRDRVPAPASGPVAAAVDSTEWLPQPAGSENLPASFSDREEAFPSGYSQLVDPVRLEELDFNSVRDVEIFGNELWLATAGGLVEYLPADSSFTIFSFPQGIEDYDCYTVLPDDETILLGTSGGVYCIDQYGDVYPLWLAIADTVTVIERGHDRYLVGTKNKGLYAVVDNAVETLLLDKSVVDVTENQFGLWAATREDGLLYFDGDKWRQRFLVDDTTAFAQTNCLESAYQRLWVGTERGVYVYDGGRWELLAPVDEGTHGNVTSFARGRGFIYFGAEDSGVYCYNVFDGSSAPLTWSESLEVTALAYSAGRYLVGTESDGAVFRTPRRQLEIKDLFATSAELAFSW